MGTFFVLFVIAFILLPSILMTGWLVVDTFRSREYFATWMLTGVFGMLVYLLIFNPLVTN